MLTTFQAYKTIVIIMLTIKLITTPVLIIPNIMLPMLQLITLDYWENVYNMVVATGGPIHVIFFTIVVFFGSFYLINLMLAVVAMSYEEEAEICLAVRGRGVK